MSSDPNYTKEFFIYILFEPKIIDPNSSNRPVCFLGVTPNPLKAYQKHLDRAGGQQQPGQWIQQMHDLCEVKPTMKILESVRSTYTRNDKYTLLDTWRWVALASGFQLLTHNNVDEVDDADRQAQVRVYNRTYSLRFGDDVRYFSRISTHGDEPDSIQPLFGYSIMTVDGDMMNFSQQADREEALQTALESSEDWKVPPNPKQREKHLAIVDEKASRQHPAVLAKQHAAPILAEATSWTELKQALWTWRWTIHRSPRGAVLFDGKYPTKLQKIRSQFALEKLEQRFGEKL